MIWHTMRTDHIVLLVNCAGNYTKEIVIFPRAFVDTKVNPVSTVHASARLWAVQAGADRAY